jgi:hypothetical protein
MGLAAGAVREGLMVHFYAIAERSPEGGWFLTFPGGTGYSFAENAEQIVPQAQDWLASAAMGDGQLPRSIEDGATPPADLSDFEQPAMVVVIPFVPTTAAKAA